MRVVAFRLTIVPLVTVNPDLSKGSLVGFYWIPLSSIIDDLIHD
ncbi:hypothetical protein [Paenibacillus sp. LHD-38]|nr:hypothetical protein [Paenibacillus sp. LHD-38]MDQ8735205.1 hypothetical protein [Paenibacillus sp. LHD-38]